MDSQFFLAITKAEWERSGSPEHLQYAHQTGILAAYCAEMYRRLAPEDQAFMNRVMGTGPAEATCAPV